MSRRCAMVLMLALLWGCGGERVMQSGEQEQVGRPLGKVAVGQSTAPQAVVVATLRRDDRPVTGVTVEFSRSIAGQAASYQWSGMTDEEGQTRVEIASGDVTGYYLARATLDGREIGAWTSIPINRGYEARLDLPIDGKARVRRSTPLTLKIGVLYTALSRSNTLRGAELAAMQMNEAGGVRGVPIELIPRGGLTTPEYAAEAAEELIAQREVMALVGPNRSGHAVAVAAVAQAHGVPMMTTTATNPTVTAAGDFVFMAAFTDDFQGRVMAQFAARELGAESAAIIAQEGAIYSEGLARTFADNFNASGGALVAREFYMDADTTFTAQLTAIAQAAPDVVFLSGFFPEIPLVIGQAKRDIDLLATFLGGDSWDNAILLTMNRATFDGSFFSGHFSSQVGPDDLSEEAYRFIDAYTAVFGVAPPGGAAMGYDALRLVVQAMCRTEDLTPEAIRDQIAATQNYSGATMISEYNENRHPTKSAVINRIVNGKVEFYKLINP